MGALHISITPNNFARIAEIGDLKKIQQFLHGQIVLVQLESKLGLFSSKAHTHAVVLGSDLLRCCIKMNLKAGLLEKANKEGRATDKVAV